MKTAAAIFSWLGGIGNIVVGFIYALMWNKYIIYLNGYSYRLSDILSPIWVWFFWGIGLIVNIILLGWRQNSVEDGNKVGCGICTLLFVSFIGGVLTLCIPESQLNKANYYKKINTLQSPYLTQRQIDDKINIYKSLLQKGTITKAEYNAYLSKMGIRTSQDDKKEKENQSIELIKNYKKLLDDGIISQEEFDKKKKELLN